MFKSTIAAAALMSAFSAFAADNLVTCGGFECMYTPAGSLTYYTGDTFYGWDVTSGPSLEERNALVGTAQAGVEYVELDSQANSAISQTISTVKGQTYQLTFYASSRAVDTNWNYGYNPVNGVIDGSTQGLTATFGTSVVKVLTPTNTTANNIWTEYTTTFKATGSTTSLSFAATGLSDSYGTALDSVSVSAVPEPASVALMGIGALALVGMARRKSAK